MSGWQLTLKAQPPLRVDAAALLPGDLTREELLRLPLPSGRDTLAVADLFDVAPRPDAVWALHGDLSRFDRVGAGLAEGELQVHGPVGHQLGLCMSGGRLWVAGAAADEAGQGLRGGWLQVQGSVGDFAASAQPGEMDGMRGGTFVIGGHAGVRLADRMRRGTLVLHGDAGDFCASRLVAGTVVLGGRCGAHLGYGMRRGTVVCVAHRPALANSFVPVPPPAPVFWALLARDLARFGAPFDALAQRPFTRHAGDQAAAGLGEVWCPASP